MKKINIKDLELKIDILDLKEKIKQNNFFYLTLDLNVYFKVEDIKNEVIIFKGDKLQNILEITDIKEFALKLFSAYKPSLVGTVCKLKPVVNWNNIIEYNKKQMLYFDHQSDGVEIFEDEILEEYGYNASVLEINYRQITDLIEENCEGTLLFYDNEVQFSGFALIDDMEKTRVLVKDFIFKKTKENLENGTIEADDSEVIESMEFFQMEGN